MNGPAKKSELLPKKEGPKWLRQLRKIYKSNTFLIIFSVLCAMMLSVVGIVCFNMLFEARARYIYVMVPVMIVLAVVTLQAVVSKGLSMRRKKSAPRAEDAAAVD